MKKTIVHVHQKFYPYQGGSTQRLLNQLKNLDLRKFNIIVISQKLGKEPEFEEYLGIKIIRYKRFSEIIKILFNIEKQIGIDLIHAHNYRPTFYAQLFNEIFRKEIIVEMHSIYEVRGKIKKKNSKKSVEKVFSNYSAF